MASATKESGLANGQRRQASSKTAEVVAGGIRTDHDVLALTWAAVEDVVDGSVSIAEANAVFTGIKRATDVVRTRAYFGKRPEAPSVSYS